MDEIDAFDKGTLSDFPRGFLVAGAFGFGEAGGFFVDLVFFGSGSFAADPRLRFFPALAAGTVSGGGGATSVTSGGAYSPFS